MVIYGPYMAIYGHIWTYMVNIWPYMVHIWPIYGHISPYMAHIWASEANLKGKKSIVSNSRKYVGSKICFGQPASGRAQFGSDLGRLGNNCLFYDKCCFRSILSISGPSRRQKWIRLEISGIWVVSRGQYEKISPFRGKSCLLYTSPSPRDRTRSRMPSSA